MKGLTATKCALTITTFLSIANSCDMAIFHLKAVIDQPTYEIGRLATELLFKLIDGEEIEKMIYRIQPELIIRDSVKKILR
jgi:DNA-binding LacI/PurR family transcriptional regulator